MGNTCVGPSIGKNGFLQSVSAAVWRTRPDEALAAGNEVETVNRPPVYDVEPESPVQSKPPEQMSIPKSEKKDVVKPKKPQMKRVPSAGLRTDSVLQRKTGNLKEVFTLGKKLGQGQFGITFLCVEKATGKEYACKSIAKRKLLTEEDVEDVRREIQIMHHLAGHPNVISIKGAYEDAVSVHVVMELCAGGELFDRIIQRGHYTERKAAELTRTIVGVVEECHSLGVMHRDLKPENFLLVDKKEDSLLKTIDFGLSVFFKPGETFSDVVGSPYYVAPEVLRKHYGPEADVWSAGVMVYILLSGVPPFWDETEQGIFDQVLHGDLDFSSDPWPSISESAKDLVRKMLVRDPKKRLNAHEVLCHPWVQVDGVAPDKPLDSAVISRIKQFSAMNKLKKMALRVIAESLSEEEIAGLKQMFEMIDTDNSGHITFEELKAGISRIGSNLKESEIYDLMQAADVDNSGTIDYGEFVAATLHLNKVEKEDHLFAAFSYFDKDGSGYITQDELQQACEEFGIEDTRLEEMIREADQDNDGRIDYNEFVTMMHGGNAGHVAKKGFHMGDEVFGEVMLPNSLANDIVYDMSVGVFGDSLAALKYNKETGHESCCVWVMREYGVADSWTKLYTINVPERLTRTIGFRKDGEVILSLSNNELVSYDTETSTIKDLGIVGNIRSFYVGTYVESLVLLKGQSSVREGISNLFADCATENAVIAGQ